jgi:hypothetical protein
MRRNANNILVAKLWRKRECDRPKCIWKDNIEMNLKETGCKVVDWIRLVRDRVQWRSFVDTVMKLGVP